MFLRELFESNSTPSVVFVLGSASQGKSSVADKVVEEEFGFTLIDLDRPADKYRKQFNIPDSIPKMTDAEKARQAEKKELRKQGKLPPAPKMTDFEDPEDYLKTIPAGKHGPHHAMIAAGAVTKKQAEQAIANKEDLVFVETGGKAGMKGRIEQFKELGYNVYCIFVAIHPELDLNSERDFNAVAKETIRRQKNRSRQLDPEIIKKALKQSQKTKEKVLPLFQNIEFVDTGKLDQAQSADRTRQIMKAWGL